MAVAGIDIGSRTTKLVILEEDCIIKTNIIDTNIGSVEESGRILDSYPVTKIVATGYGRHLANSSFADDVITEIKAYAIGARYLFPDCRTVIDIGGQDSKVIRLDGNSGFSDFVMNDRCAAGTGRFLEVMAKILGYDIDSFGEQALNAENPVNISSMCTVFAESEVISLLAEGKDSRNISLGLHHAITRRLLSMANKLGLGGGIVFGGGVAKNKCMVSLLEKEIGQPICIPENPQIVGALGAALEAQVKSKTGS